MNGGVLGMIDLTIKSAIDLYSMISSDAMHMGLIYN